VEYFREFSIAFPNELLMDVPKKAPSKKAQMEKSLAT
jgi:hypothetical protein